MDLDTALQTANGKQCNVQQTAHDKCAHTSARGSQTAENLFSDTTCIDMHTI